MTEAHTNATPSTVNADMSVADLLGVLNEQRKLEGRDALSGWKGTKDKLIRSIEETTKRVANLDPKIEEGSTASADAGKSDIKVIDGDKGDAEKAKKTLDKAAKKTAKKASKEDSEPRKYPKGIFKSKVPGMADTRGKVWKTSKAKLADGTEVEAKYESTKGTYFYIFDGEICFSGKIADFAKMTPTGGIRLFDLSSVA